MVWWGKWYNFYPYLMNRANVDHLPLLYFCKAISLTQFAFWSLYIFTQLIYKNQYACPTLGKNLGAWMWAISRILKLWSVTKTKLRTVRTFRVLGFQEEENWGQVFKALIHKVYFLFAVFSFLFFPWKTLNLSGQVLLWVPFSKAIGNRKRKP